MRFELEWALLKDALVRAGNDKMMVSLVKKMIDQERRIAAETAITAWKMAQKKLKKEK